MPDPPPRALDIFSHIIEAELEWIDRLEQGSDRVSVWPQRGLHELPGFLDTAIRRWTDHLAALTDAQLGEPVDDHSTSGLAFTNSRAEIALHLALHSAEHRGQIGLLAGSDEQPIETQYAWFLRAGAKHKARARRRPLIVC